VATLFERGAFDAAATQATATALAAYALGLPAYVGIRVFTPGFFAREDTKTPVIIAAFSIVVNIILNLVLMEKFAHVGIAMASSISAWLNVFSLIVILGLRGHYQMDRRLLVRSAGIVVASVIMGGALWFGAAWATPYLAAGMLIEISTLSVLIIGGAVLYFLSARLLGVFSITEIKAAVRCPPPTT